MYPDDGDGTDFGEHVVSVDGQDRIEFRNVSGNSYQLGNPPFAISSPWAPAVICLGGRCGARR
jgi:hypothetical protein